MDVWFTAPSTTMFTRSSVWYVLDFSIFLATNAFSSTIYCRAAESMPFLFFCVLSLSYIPLYMHVRPGYGENHLICKGHSSYTHNFITECRGSTDPAMKIGMYIILCVHAVWLQTHPCLKGNLQDLGTCIFSASVVFSAQLLILFACVISYTHVYLAMYIDQLCSL